MKLGARRLHGIEARRKEPSPARSRAEFTSYNELVAFDEVVESLEAELRRFVSRKVRAEAVDDVLQEVWVAAWQALPTFDRKSKIRTWIYGICVHKCHDSYRSQQAQSRLVPLDDLPLIDGSPSIEQTTVQTDTINRLLAGLDETQREVLELYYYAQLTLAEISAVLERNLNTVKYQFYRAHAVLIEAGEREKLQ